MHNCGAACADAHRWAGRLQRKRLQSRAHLARVSRVPRRLTNSAASRSAPATRDAAARPRARQRRAADGHAAPLAAFAEHVSARHRQGPPRRRRRPGAVVQSDEFPDPQAAAVQRLDDGGSRAASAGSPALLVGQCHGVVHGQRLGQRLGRARRAHAIDRVGRNLALPAPPAVQAAPARQCQRDAARRQPCCACSRAAQRRTWCVCTSRNGTWASCACACSRPQRLAVQRQRVRSEAGARPPGRAAGWSRRRLGVGVASAASLEGGGGGGGGEQARQPRAGDIRRCAAGTRCPCRRCSAWGRATPAPACRTRRRGTRRSGTRASDITLRRIV